MFLARFLYKSGYFFTVDVSSISFFSPEERQTALICTVLAPLNVDYHVYVYSSGQSSFTELLHSNWVLDYKS